MSELLTAAQMRAFESAAIDSGSVSGLELMERAGRGVVEAIFEEWPELRAAPYRAVVLCGPGNNGGDGFVIARLLKEWGWDVALYLYGAPEKLPPDARTNFESWSALGETHPIEDADLRCGESGPSLVVDALFGTGLARPLEGLESICFNLSDFVDLTRDGAQPDPRRFLVPIPKVVAVDIPSGFCSDSGRFLGHGSDAGAVTAAHLTATFHRRKLGHVLDLGAESCGKVRVVDIGLDGRPAPTLETRLRRGDAPGLTPLPDPSIVRLTARPGAELRKAAGHKYSHGHALVLSGGSGRGGAARLAARGALRIGAGLVTLGCPQGAVQENAAHLDAIMLRCFREIGDLIEFLADERINAVGLGPGLGKGERAQQQVTAVLAAERATVLDADALTVHEDDPASLFYQLHETCVLTPHAGEFRRLFPDLSGKLADPATTGPAYSRVDAVREAAARAGCTVLLKGPDTVIADATGRCAVNASAGEAAAPWLATAGSGDVLAGFIAGLLARGLAPFEAAGTAAWLHAECARCFGPGLIAEDLPEELPRVFRDLGL